MQKHQTKATPSDSKRFCFFFSPCFSQETLGQASWRKSGWAWLSSGFFMLNKSTCSLGHRVKSSWEPSFSTVCIPGSGGWCRYRGVTRGFSSIEQKPLFVAAHRSNPMIHRLNPMIFQELTPESVVSPTECLQQEPFPSDVATSKYQDKLPIDRFIVDLMLICLMRWEPWTRADVY